MQTNLQQNASQLKQEGNILFKNKQYEQAIAKYSLAIQIQPNSIYYSNRARCYNVLGKHFESLKDAEQAILLDPKNIKAYFLKGEALLTFATDNKDPEKIEEAIEMINTSLRLCPSQKKNDYEEKFINEIYIAKKKLWQLKAEQQRDKKKALRSYLISIIENDSNLSQDQKDSMNEKVQCLLNKQITPEKNSIPKALVCTISKKLMKNPVCNEYGNSYSKQQYTEYLKENNKDPISQKEIKTNLLYPNINLKKAIQDFLQKNPWAYQQEVF